MNETNSNDKKNFSNLGMVYTIFSVVVTLLQYVVSQIGVKVFSPEVFNTNVQMMVSSCILYVIGMLILPCGLKKVETPKATLTRHKISAGDMVSAFCMCYALLIGSNIAGMMINAAIGTLKGSPVVNPVEILSAEMSFPVLILLTVVIAPIFEELFFRKFIIDKVVCYGEMTAVLISGFMFGLFHGNLSQFPYAFAIGIFFGIIYIRTGNIIYSIILHAAVNFLGSIASALVASGAGYDVLNDIMSATTETEAMAAISLENLTGLIGLIVFELILIIIVIIGIIMWILEGKKIGFYTRPNDIQRGKRFQTTLGNPGMAAYIVVWLVMIIYSLF